MWYKFFCDWYLTLIIHINKTHAEKCHFTANSKINSSHRSKLDNPCPVLPFMLVHLFCNESGLGATHQGRLGATPDEDLIASIKEKYVG